MVTTRSYLSDYTSADNRAVLAPFTGFAIKKAHAPECCCAYSKRPRQTTDGKPRYAAVEFVKKRDSRGRLRRVPVRFRCFCRRVDAADQALEWILYRTHPADPAIAASDLSRAYKKQMARRLKQSGLRVSFCAQDPLASLFGPAESRRLERACGRPSVTPVCDEFQKDVHETPPGTSGVVEVGSCPPNTPAVVQNRRHLGLGLLERACHAVSSALQGWRAYRAKRASCTNN